MHKNNDTREEILRTASRLLQKRGYNGFSYGHIAEALGVKTAAVHYHFKTKEELGIALAERFREGWRAFRADYADAAPVARLEVLYALYGRLANKGRVCPLSVIHAELDAVPEPVVAAAKEVLDEILDWLEQALEDGQRDGTLDFEGSARDLALVLMATAQGSLHLVRTQGLDAFKASRKLMIRSLFLARPNDSASPLP